MLKMNHNFIIRNGPIAQEVEAIYPELVRKPTINIDKYTTYHLVYSGFGPIEIMAIQ